MVKPPTAGSMAQPCSLRSSQLVRLSALAFKLACLALAPGNVQGTHETSYYYSPNYYTPTYSSSTYQYTPPPKKKKKANGGAIAGAVIGAVVGIALIIAAIVWYRRRQQRKRAELGLAPPPSKPSPFTSLFSSCSKQFRPLMRFIAPAYAAGGKEGRLTSNADNGKDSSCVPTSGALKLPPPGSVMAVPYPNIQPPSMAIPATVTGTVTSASQAMADPTTTATTMRTYNPITMSTSSSMQPPPHVTVQMQPMYPAVASAVSGELGAAGMYGGRPMVHVPDTAAVVTSKTGDSLATPRTGGAVTAGITRSVAAPTVSTTLENLRIHWSEIQMSGELGKGGFAVVYKGLWAGNRVAVKVLNRERASASVLSSLHQEALIMSELRHPCLVRVFGLVDEAPHHALVMQYYRKGTLSRFMGTPAYAWVDIAARLRLAIQVASGMKHLHARNILHSDLKTSNILLDDEGNAVIADFGLASLQEDQQAEVAQSGAHTVSISPPEVLMNPRIPRTQAGDVYAFAIVLLEIMAARPAYPGLKSADIKYVVTSGNRPPITADVPPVVADIITHCWQPQPSDRPSFATILERLTAAAQQLGPGLDDTTITQTTTTYL